MTVNGSYLRLVQHHFRNDQSGSWERGHQNPNGGLVCIAYYQALSLQHGAICASFCPPCSAMIGKPVHVQKNWWEAKLPNADVAASMLPRAHAEWRYRWRALFAGIIDKNKKAASLYMCNKIKFRGKSARETHEMNQDSHFRTHCLTQIPVRQPTLACFLWPGSTAPIPRTLTPEQATTTRIDY